MEFDKYNDQELNHKIMKVCIQADEHIKDQLIRESMVNPRIPAIVFNNLYALVDYDLNFVIDILNHSSEKEKNAILKEAQDVDSLYALFAEYDRDTLKKLEIEDIVQGRNLDVIWEIKKGSQGGEMSKAYLERCMLTLAYHIGFAEEIRAFFESEKRKYLTLH